MYARRHEVWAWVCAYRLSPAERRAAHAELRAEQELRRERDNQETADRRAAAVAAEAVRESGYMSHH